MAQSVRQELEKTTRFRAGAPPIHRLFSIPMKSLAAPAIGLYLFVIAIASSHAKPSHSAAGLATEPIVLSAFKESAERIRKGEIGGWQAGIGEWRIENGALIGDELEANHHASSCTYRFEATHLIIRAQVQLGDATQIAIGCRDTVPPNLHLSRLYITPNSIWIQKMSGISKSTRKEILTTREVAIDPQRWYDVTIEIIGDSYVASVGDHTIEARHERFADAKGIVALINRGLGARFKNVELWHAKSST